MQGPANKAIETSILTGHQTALQAVPTSFVGGNGRQATESGTLTRSLGQLPAAIAPSSLTQTESKRRDDPVAPIESGDA